MLIGSRQLCEKLQTDAKTHKHFPGSMLDGGDNQIVRDGRSHDRRLGHPKARMS
jgi:hypothetical protein